MNTHHQTWRTRRAAWASLALLVTCLSTGCDANPHLQAPPADTTKSADQDARADELALPDQVDALDALAPDPTTAVFDPDHVLEVAIELAPADWDALRQQTRTLLDVLGPGCLDAPPDPVFTYFQGSVTIDGVRVESVGVRKKGFLGSLSLTKPSLKLKFDEFVAQQEFSGLERMTLNNAQQDPSLVAQCLGYGVFAAAGVPAPRCNFAHVRVNREDLGVFVHVESVRKAFLRRHFADDEGKLYEGTLSDFRPAWMATFEKKTNRAAIDNHAELEGVMVAADTPDAQLFTQLGAAVDLDAFVTFWAAEVLVGHWDGYAANANNFFVYFDPTNRSRAHFVPWGADGVFTNVRSSAMVTGVVARRLYEHPDGQALYVARLRALLGDVWDEEALYAEVDRMEALLAPYVLVGEEPGRAVGLQIVRQFIRDRRAMIVSELDAGLGALDGALRDAPCAREMGSVHVDFATTWGTLPIEDLFATGTGTFALTVDGQTPTCVRTGAKAGLGTEQEQLGKAVVTLAGLTDGTVVYVVSVELAPERVVAGEVPIDWTESSGYLAMVDTATGQFALVGLLGDGVLTFSAAGTRDGDALTGSLQATVYVFGF